MTGDEASKETLSIRHGSDITPIGGEPHAQSAVVIPDPHEIGPFKLLELLGEGGMGTVYLAEQTKPIHRRVALKIIKLGMDTKQVIARFETEREALALMNHANVARVFDAGATETGRPYFAMEYVAGIPITDYCDKHRLTTQERLHLFMQVCHAVQHAHQKGIIHRDIKPSNVLVSVQDDKPVVKVIDFGVAKATQHRFSERTLFTEHGQLVGTPGYMSPEQAEMTALDIDTRTDIYSLGVLLYELLVGALPFDTKTLLQCGFAEIQRVIRQVDPPKPSTKLSSIASEPRAAATGSTGMGPGTRSRIDEIARCRHTELKTLIRQIRGELDWIVMRAIEKDRTRRYETANGLALEIERYLDNEPVLAGPPSMAYRIRKFVRRNRGPVAAGVLVIVVLIAGIAGTSYGLVQAVRAREAEARQRLIAEANERNATEEAVLAEHARAEAAAQRDRAEREARTSAQVSEFLVELFAVPDPSKPGGSKITVRELLDRGTNRISSELSDQPEAQGRMLNTIGRIYEALGLYSEAETLVRKAVSVREGVYGPDHPTLAESLNSLGAVLLQLGAYDEAEELFLRSLSIRQRAFGQQHVLVADTLSNLGVLMRRKGAYAASEAFHRQALQIRRELLSPGHPWIAESLTNLGSVLRDQGELPEAENAWREALAIRRAVRGENHPETAQALNNLSIALFERGRYGEALPFIEQAIAIRRQMGDPEHPALAEMLNTLGSILLAAGEVSRAESVFQDSRSILQKAFPFGHPTIWYTESLLGSCLTRLERFDEAEALLVPKYPMVRLVRGAGDKYALEWLQRVIDLYEAWDRPEKVAQYRAMLPAGEPSRGILPDPTGTP